MMKLVILSGLVLSASCMVLHQPQIPLALGLQYHDTPNYNFAYEVNDAHTGDIKSQHESRRGETVLGQYSLLQPDGVRRTVDYRADEHAGFRATVNHQVRPTRPIQPTQQLYRAQASIEIPTRPAQLYQAQARLETPTRPAQLYQAQARLETPTRPAQLYQAQARLETPTRPAQLYQAQARLETPTRPAQLYQTQARIETPTRPTQLYQAQASIETQRPSLAPANLATAAYIYPAPTQYPTPAPAVAVSRSSITQTFSNGNHNPWL